jgi:TRAP transporter TAXI family solute receptor
MFRYLSLAVLALGLVCILTYQVLHPRVSNTNLVLTTGSEGGVYYPLGQALADAVRETHPHINIFVHVSDGSAQNRDRILAGEAELGLMQNDTPPHTRLRSLMPLHIETFHFFATEKSGINDVRHLKGRRVALGSPDSGTRRIAEHVLAHFQLGPADVRLNEEGAADAKTKLIAGELDAMFYMGSMTADLCRELLINTNVRLVSLGQDDRWLSSVPALRIGYPYVEQVTIPRGLFYEEGGNPQPYEPVFTLGLRSLLVCDRDLSPAIGRDIVSAISEQRSLMMRDVPQTAEITEEFSANDIHIPLHRGARAYFDRSEPGFLERYAESMAFIMSALFATWGVIAALRKALNRRKKDRIDVYYVALNASIEKLESEDITLEVIDEMNIELGQLRAKAINELTRERLLADESFQIFQSLLSDCQAHLASQRARLVTEAKQKPADS